MNNSRSTRSRKNLALAKIILDIVGAIAKVIASNRKGKAMVMASVDQVEAVELFNYLNNERDLYSMMVTRFRRFQYEIKRNDYNQCYAEASCHEVALMASRRYCREYCRGENPSVMFPLAIRSACAKLMVREFEVEFGAGNRW